MGVEKDFVEFEEEVDNANNTVDKFIRKLEVLTELGVDLSKMTQLDTIKTLAEKSGVKIAVNQANKLGIELNDRIGNSRDSIVQAYRGAGDLIKPTEKQVKRLLELGISLEKKSRTSKEIAEATISSLKDIELADKEDKALQELNEKEYSKIPPEVLETIEKNMNK